MLPDDRPAVLIKDWASPYHLASQSLDPAAWLEWDARRRVWWAPRPNGDGRVEVPDAVVEEHLASLLAMGQDRTTATHNVRSVAYWYESEH